MRFRRKPKEIVDPNACVFGPEEWCGAFIGRQHCSTHGGRRDRPGQWCHLAPQDIPSVVQLIELHGVYDGWSVKIMSDGRAINRWANADGTPAEGYERRYKATQAWIDAGRFRTPKAP